jgi:hypothetical protein
MKWWRGRCRRTESARGPSAPSVSFADTSPARCRYG